jgi:hypothetical protein
MKYSKNYSKLDTIFYTTIRRYHKGKIGDILLETYPKGEHYAEIIGIRKFTLNEIPIQTLIADTDLFNRKEIYDLFQSFYSKPIDFDGEKFYLYQMRKQKGEICGICGIGMMNHPKLYVYECSYCSFSYRIDPSGKIPKITILNRGNK